MASVEWPLATGHWPFSGFSTGHFRDFLSFFFFKNLSLLLLLFCAGVTGAFLGPLLFREPACFALLALLTYLLLVLVLGFNYYSFAQGAA